MQSVCITALSLLVHVFLLASNDVQASKASEYCYASKYCYANISDWL